MTIEEYFPFQSFRVHQKEIINKIKNDFENGIKVIILDGPTGFGKSPVNITLGKYFKPTFYTTPQTKLVKQLAKDFGPKELAIDGGISDIMPLLGRNNYICRETNKKSDLCPIAINKNENCANYECTYWKQKIATINADISILTFAMLIINNYIIKGGSRFSKRNLLIIDECHNLEDQVASLFCGFSISPYSFPSFFREPKKQNIPFYLDNNSNFIIKNGESIWDVIKKDVPDNNKIENHFPFLIKIQEICNITLNQCNYIKEKRKLLNLIRKIDYLFEELKEKRKWVINIIPKRNYTTREFKPIKIDNFLKKMIWSQTNLIILSSATIPFRNQPEKWLKRLGLKDKSFSFHSIPMTFPIKNRLIITKLMGGKMTNKKEEENWDTNIKNIKIIISHHINDKGVIHTQSYKRAERLAHDLNNYDIFLHNKHEINDNIITDWINSGKKILISPAITNGVDLKDDLCRYQILLKIPYPSIGDARVSYLLNIKKDWNWYYQETMKDIIQAYGRAIRSETDFAKFYIIDGSFKDIYRKVKFPTWFSKAII
ncbi:3'-5' exonuclease DinG [subsurface metagenome]